MILSPSLVAYYAQTAGFKGPSLVTAVAIAHAESGFDDAALGDVGLENAVWGPSVGLWQIRTLKDSPPHIRDLNWLTGSPFNQAVAAYAISSNGANFTPWSTFKSGAFLQYMDEAQNAVNTLNGGAVTTPIPVNMVPTPTGKGYWILFSDGAVFSYGDAVYEGRAELINGVWEPVK